MQESLVLRQLTNLPMEASLALKKENSLDMLSQSSSTESRPPLEELIRITSKQLDFGLCLPGSIHEKIFTVTLLQQLEETAQLSVNILCEDQALYDCSSLIFGIKRVGQQQFYDDYRMKIKSKRIYEFRVGVKTPMFYEYDVKSIMYLTFSDYAPFAVVLKQRVQIPQIVCTKELYFDEQRIIKLSTIQNRGKKQCRVPFKMNHHMTISVTADVLGLQDETVSLIDVKPKSMTLSGKGQFSLLLTMNMNQQIRDSLSLGVPSTVRRILTLKIKQTNFMYHFPIEVVYYPEPKKGGSVSIQEP